MGSRHFLFVPGIAPDTYLLYFGREERSQAYTLRDYSGGGKPRLIQGRDLPYDSAQLLKMAEDRLSAPEHDIDDDAFWREVILELNRHLVARLAGAGRGRPAEGTPVRPFRYPVLGLPQLLHHDTKGSRAEDVARILHSQHSRDWVTWNCVRLLEGIDPAAWWPRLVELARADNQEVDIQAEPGDLPELRTWGRHPAPDGWEPAARERAAAEGRGLILPFVEPEPVRREMEVDLEIGGRDYLVHVEAKLDAEPDLDPELDEVRNRIVWGVDALLGATQDRRPGFWLLVTSTDPRLPHVRALKELRRGPAALLARLPHRSPAQVEAVRRNLVMLRWQDVVQYLRGFYDEVFKELDRRVRP